MTTFTEDPLIGKIPALADGHVYGLVDKIVGLADHQPVAAVGARTSIDNFLPGASPRPSRARDDRPARPSVPPIRSLAPDRRAVVLASVLVLVVAAGRRVASPRC